MDEPTDFDAADLADAILGVDEPLPAEPLPPPPSAHADTSRTAGASIGPFLTVALVAAVGLAIILAIGAESRTEPPQPCGGLYTDAIECCVDAYVCDPPCERRDDQRGLFDAEERFAPDGLPWC